MMPRPWLAAALFALFAPLSAWAAGVQATLDRNTVQLGETVTLNLQVQGAGSSIAMPDLQALQQDFTILGTSQNHSVSVVNGQASSTMTIGVALRPNHVGTLTIPALNVGGGQTAPLQLTVDPAKPDAAARVRGDVFMEAQVTPAQGYVGEQFSYVQRLYYAVNISSGTPWPTSARTSCAAWCVPTFRPTALTSSGTSPAWIPNCRASLACSSTWCIGSKVAPKWTPKASSNTSSRA